MRLSILYAASAARRCEGAEPGSGGEHERTVAEALMRLAAYSQREEDAAIAALAAQARGRARRQPPSS